jgi:hypothetical protein
MEASGAVFETVIFLNFKQSAILRALILLTISMVHVQH